MQFITKKRLFLCIILCLWFSFGKNDLLAQKKLKNTKDIIHFIQKQQKKWHKKYSFTQKNLYPDSEGNISGNSRSETILEYIQSPNTLAIYYPKDEEGNTKNPIKLQNDTLYMYDAKKNIVQKLYYDMPLVWLSGGLGAYEVKTIFEKLKKIGINPEKSYQNDQVLTIGTDKPDDTTSPQVQYDAKKTFLKRVFIPDYKGWHEAIFENQEVFGNGWIETRVSIFKNQKILISEYYQNIKAPQTKEEQADFDRKIKIK